MGPLGLVCWVFALVFFLIAGFMPEPAPRRLSFIAFGLACIAIAVVFAGALPFFNKAG